MAGASRCRTKGDPGLPHEGESGTSGSVKEEIQTTEAPTAIGPYSQAIRTGEFVFVSGQIPLRPDGSGPVDGIDAQTHQVLTNLKAILHAAGLELSDVVKTTIFLTDLANFQVVNEIYAEFFGEPHPARSTIQVVALPKGALVEIEAIAGRNA